MAGKRAVTYNLNYRSAVRDFLEEMRVANYSPDTVAVYASTLGQMGDYLEGVPLHRLDRVDRAAVSGYMSFLKSRPKRFSTRPGTDGVSDEYYRTQHRRLRRFFGWCVASGYVREDPMEGMPNPRVGKKLVPMVQDETIRHLLLLTDPKSFDTPARRFRAFRDRAVLMLLVDTPVRRTELARLQIDDLDLDDRTVRVLGKGRKERLQYIGVSTVKVLRG